MKSAIQVHNAAVDSQRMECHVSGMERPTLLENVSLREFSRDS